MRKLYFNVVLEKLNIPDSEKTFFQRETTIRRMFEDMLIAGLNNKFPSGMPTRDGRILNRILEKLDKSDDNFFLILEESEFDLVKSAFDENARFQPGQYRLICQYQENIEKAEILNDGTKTG
jgi:hypothetical protein